MVSLTFTDKHLEEFISFTTPDSNGKYHVVLDTDLYIEYCYEGNTGAGFLNKFDQIQGDYYVRRYFSNNNAYIDTRYTISSSRETIRLYVMEYRFFERRSTDAVGSYRADYQITTDIPFDASARSFKIYTVQY